MGNVVMDLECYRFEDSSLLEKPLKQHLCFKGSGQNEILVIFRDDAEFLSTPHKNMLEKMFTATGNPFESTVAVNFNHSKITSFAALNNIFFVNSIIVLGISPNELKMNLAVKKNKVINFNNQKILFTDSLSDLDRDKTLKSPLWQELQQMFGIRK